mgnify:CR=1 FL=1
MRMRKFIIGSIGAAVVIVAYIIYSNVVEVKPIETPKNDQSKVLEVPQFNGLKSLGGSEFGDMEDSEFITRDEQTKELKRVFGFNKLLNPEEGSDKWRLKSPYMHFFGDSFQCEITSNDGDFRLERVMGKLAPRNGKLYGDVRINITIKRDGQESKGVVYLENLDYDSERSELATDNSVRAVFQDAVMEGTGMVLIYNSAKTRIEYFELFDLDFIHIKDVAVLSESNKDEPGAETATAEDKRAKPKLSKKANTADSVAAGKADSHAAGAGAKIEKTTAVKAESNAGAVPDGAEGQAEKIDGDLYHCRFRDEVKIEYGDELIVVSHEELNILNLLFGGGDSGSEDKADRSGSKEPAKTARKENNEKTEGVSGGAKTATAPVASSGGKVDSEIKADIADDAASGESDGNELTKESKNETPEAGKKATEVVITCNDGFIIQLMENAELAKENQQKSTETALDYLRMSEEGFAGWGENYPVKKAEENRIAEAPFSADACLDTSLDFMESSYVNFSSGEPDVTPAEDTQGEKPTKPTEFYAKRIDYDMLAEHGLATGPVELIYYTFNEDPNTAAEQEFIPVRLTAADNAEYFALENRAYFNGEVVAERRVFDPNFITENALYGDKMVVDLLSKGSKADVSDGDNDEDLRVSSIKHLKVEGKEVLLDSIRRKKNDEILRYIRLICKQIDYEAADETVIAAGPGSIEYNNAQPADSTAGAEGSGRSGGQPDMQGPCYAVIQNFDVLKWNTGINKITVDAKEGETVRVQYLPIVDLENQEYGQVKRSSAGHVEANFMTTLDGQTELAALTATDTVSYSEESYNEHEGISLVGENLFYNVYQSTLLITGTEERPCNVNGNDVERIKYNPATHELITEITTPGTILIGPEN